MAEIYPCEVRICQYLTETILTLFFTVESSWKKFIYKFHDRLN